MSPRVRNEVPHGDALARLRAGNDRFSTDVRSVDSMLSQGVRGALARATRPFAAVLACSDSRIPSEIIFDVGLGELFVVRLAGNVVAPSIVGSIEFAASEFGVELVVVMGHTGCAAIASAIDAIDAGGLSPTNNMRDIVDRIAPSVAHLVKGKTRTEEAVPIATRANVRASVEGLRHGSPVLERKIAGGRLVVLGAEYARETGKVEFFDVA